MRKLKMVKTELGRKKSKTVKYVVQMSHFPRFRIIIQFKSLQFTVQHIFKVYNITANSQYFPVVNWNSKLSGKFPRNKSNL